MSLGSAIGAAVGGIVGFLIPGLGVLGAVYGAAIGFGVGLILDPIRPDVAPPGKPQVGQLQMTTADEGLPVADVLGTTKLVGNILWYANNRTVEILAPEPETGKGGSGISSSSGPQVEGYNYYLTWAVGICSGPIDTLYTVYKGEECVWEGELNRPASGGEETVSVIGVGSMTFFFGTNDQVAPSGITNLLEDPTLYTNYRGLCYAFFNDGFIGQYNRLPVFKFVVKKSPPFDFNADKEIETYFYNPAHAIYYILTQMIGLGTQYVNVSSFWTAANKLFLEDRGVTVLTDRQAEGLSFLESLLNHIDGVLRWGIDGRLHLKLMRADEDINEMLVVTEDIMLDDLTLDRKSWLDTQNEIKVQYPLLVVGDCELCLDNDTVAPVLTQTGTNGDVGQYEITEGCEPFSVETRIQSSPWGPWTHVKTVTGRKFNSIAEFISCRATQTVYRQLRVVDTWGRESNYIDANQLPYVEMVWGGDPTKNVGDVTADISWSGGSPPFTLRTFNPLLTFDEQFYSTVLQTGHRQTTLYFTDQICGRHRIQITDACERIINGYIQINGNLAYSGTSDGSIVDDDEAVQVWTGGVGPFNVELLGSFEDLWLNEAKTITTTTTISNGITVYSGPEACGTATVQVTDTCGDVVSRDVSHHEACFRLIRVRLREGSREFNILWNPDINAYHPFTSGGSPVTQPFIASDFNDFAAANIGPTGSNLIGPDGEFGEFGTTNYGSDASSFLIGIRVIENCLGYPRTCGWTDKNNLTLTDLCVRTTIDPPGPDNEEFYTDQTEHALIASQIVGKNTPAETTVHRFKRVEDKDIVTYAVGVPIRRDYTIDGTGTLIETPLITTVPVTDLDYLMTLEKANTAQPWSSAIQISGSGHSPANISGSHHGVYAASGGEMVMVFVNPMEAWRLDKHVPTGYYDMKFYVAAGWYESDDAENESIIDTVPRKTDFENAIVACFEAWFDHYGFSRTDYTTPNTHWPEVKVELWQLAEPTTTTTV